MEELKSYLKLKKLPHGARRLRRFNPLSEMKQFTFKDGAEFKINSNFRDSKFKQFVDAFKIKKNVPSRLPSLHVDDYSAIQLPHPKHFPVNPLFPSLINPTSIFSVVPPPFNPDFLKNAPLVLQNMLNQVQNKNALFK
ncbi:hypothetical protein RF11_10013 [Thelohanellus kitauei]|uniref:Uncharacterized protein n=1 Tax=Thelohanellus kitauei TaxID=669202 RepID=A0A0C2JS98_THEKT|nr:hypothetical protein RF11_10013 [Thelohanellus kitauei]